MADGDRGIGTGLLLDQDGHQRLTDQVAAPADDHVFPFGTVAAADEQLLHAMWRAGQEVRFPDQHPADVDGVESVHVLQRVDGIQNLIFVNVLGQRQLHQDAMESEVAVEFGYPGQKLLLAGILRIHDGLGIDAQFGAGLALAGDVGDGGWVFADANHHQARRDAYCLELRYPSLQLLADVFSDPGAAYQFCGHY